MLVLNYFQIIVGEIFVSLITKCIDVYHKDEREHGCSRDLHCTRPNPNTMSYFTTHMCMPLILKISRSM